MHGCLSALGLSTNSQTAANATFQRCAGRSVIRPVPSLCALTTSSPSWLTCRQLCQLVTLKKQSTSATAKIVSPRSDTTDGTVKTSLKEAKLAKAEEEEVKEKLDFSDEIEMIEENWELVHLHQRTT